MRTNTAKILVLLITGGLVATACGSSSHSSTASPAVSAAGTATTAAAHPATGDPIKLGMIDPVGTPIVDYPDAPAAATAAMKAINDAGGINGRPLTLDFCNAGNDVNTATGCARQLVSDGVVAEVRDFALYGGPDMNQIFHQGGVSQFALAALSQPEYNNANSFPYDGGSAFQNGGAMKVLADHGVKSVVLASSNSAAARQVEAIQKEVATKVGIKVIDTIEIPGTAADYAPFAAKIVGENPDAVAEPNGPQATALLPALQQAGYKGKYILNAVSIAKKDIPKIAAAGEGALVVNSVPFIADTTKYPILKTMAGEFRAAGSPLDADFPKSVAVQSWLGVNWLASVLKTVPTIDRASVAKALATATIDGDGIVPSLSWAQPGPISGFSRVTQSYLWWGTLKGGAYVPSGQSPINVVDLLK